MFIRYQSQWSSEYIHEPSHHSAAGLNAGKQNYRGAANAIVIQASIFAETIKINSA
jgi:hypothetical protein